MSEQLETIENAINEGIMWYAFVTNLTTNESGLIYHKTRRGLSLKLTELDNHDLHYIVKGRGYPFKVQKNFIFGNKTVELQS